MFHTRLIKERRNAMNTPTIPRPLDLSAEEPATRSNTSATFPPATSASDATEPSRPRKPLQKRRFGSGLLLSFAGMATVLIVAVGGLQDVGVRGRISMPAVALSVIAGVMMLGGGFGLMATAAPGFDDDEFDRLMRAGDAGNAPRQWTNPKASDSVSGAAMKTES